MKTMQTGATTQTETRVCFSDIVKIAHDAILAIDEGQNIVYFNQGAERIFGYADSEVIGKPITILLPPYAIEAHGTRVLDFQRLPETDRLDEQRGLSGRRKDGAIFPITASIVKTTSLDGRTVFAAILRDISENKQSEEDFRKLSRRDEKALQVARMGHWEFDILADQFTFNDQYYSLHGTTAAQAGGYLMSSEKFASKYVPQDEFHLIFECVRKSVETGDPNWQYDTETRILMADGELRDVHIWFWIEKNFHGQTTRLFGVIQDISERKQAESVLRTAEARYHALFEQSAYGVVLLDPETGETIEANAIASRQLGYTREEFAALRISDYDAVETVAETEGVMQNVLRAGNRDFEALHRTKYGEIRNVHVWATTTQVGDQTLYYVIFQDITERKRSDAELIVANQELLFQNEEKEKRAAELVVANKELIFQNQEKGKRAAELVVANKELRFQNEEKEKRAAELVVANRETAHSLQNIEALHKIDTAINSSLDLKLVLSVLLEQATAQLGVDAASVLLLNSHTQILTYAAGHGFRTRLIEKTRIRISEEFSNQILFERQMIHLRASEQSPEFARAAVFAGEGFVEYYAAPLFAKGHNIGILEVFRRKPYEADDDWCSFLETLAGQAAIAVDNAQLFQDLQHSNTNLILAYDATIEGWSRALDLRDKETEGHTQRVALMTQRLAQAMGISEAEIVHIRRGALLHDIGKMGVPDAILLKPDNLTDDEWKTMHLHPQYALEMLSPIAYLHPALDIPYCHHEKWDGSGYPRSLKGEQIPLAARLFAIVDVWDALISDRPYRKGWPQEKLVEHIKSLSGTHFEPGVVELFLMVLNEDQPQGELHIAP